MACPTGAARLMEDNAIYRTWPKAELHLHLEGSIEPGTMCELDPRLSPETIRAHYTFTGFAGFIETYKWVVGHLRSPEDYAHITRALLMRLEAEGVRYAEITLSAGVVLWKGQEFAPIFRAIREATAGSPVEVLWILDAVRHFGVDHAMQVAQLAAERVNDGVVAFSIGGDEERGPAAWFGEVFGFARNAGLRLTAHAGEGAGPESVRAALNIGAQRIGHGIRSVEDAGLVRELRDRQIPLEVCITSNVLTGVVPSLDTHPVRRLFDAGVPITLNTDDPAIFGVTLSGEYALAAGHFGFSDSEMQSIARNGFQFAFKRY